MFKIRNPGPISRDSQLPRNANFPGVFSGSGIPWETLVWWDPSLTILWMYRMGSILEVINQDKLELINKRAAYFVTGNQIHMVGETIRNMSIKCPQSDTDESSWLDPLTKVRGGEVFKSNIWTGEGFQVWFHRFFIANLKTKHSSFQHLRKDLKPSPPPFPIIFKKGKDRREILKNLKTFHS